MDQSNEGQTPLGQTSLKYPLAGVPKDGSKTPNAVGGGQGFSEYKDRPVVPKRFANEDPDDMKFDGNGTLMR